MAEAGASDAPSGSTPCGMDVFVFVPVVGLARVSVEPHRPTPTWRRHVTGEGWLPDQDPFGLVAKLGVIGTRECVSELWPRLSTADFVDQPDQLLLAGGWVALGEGR